MRRRMVRVFPDTSDLDVEYTWGGYLDITMSRAPDFGRLAPNVFYLQGFSGHGMSLDGARRQTRWPRQLQGRDRAERFDVFARLPHRDFPGGACCAARECVWRCSRCSKQLPAIRQGAGC
jgi:gamma-glutamylputrescine oxidase